MNHERGLISVGDLQPTTIAMMIVMERQSAPTNAITDLERMLVALVGAKSAEKYVNSASRIEDFVVQTILK